MSVATEEKPAGVKTGHRAASGGALWAVARAALSNAILVAVVLLGAFFTLKSNAFLTVGNFQDILINMSTLAVVAVPMAFLLIAGYLDLSVGSTLGLAGVIAGKEMVAGMDPVLAVIVALAVGAAVGIANGVCISILGFSTIVVTLGTLTLVQGLALAIAPNPVSSFPNGFVQFGQNKVLGVPELVIVALVVLAAGWVILNRTPFGRHVFALGISPKAAFLSGIRIRRVGFIVFVATGACAALAGVMEIAQLDSAPSDSLGVGFEITVLTAVLLGGVAFTGGHGSLIKVGLGVLFLGMLQNGLVLLNVPNSWSLFVTGGALVVAAGFAVVSHRLDRGAAPA